MLHKWLNVQKLIVSKLSLLHLIHMYPGQNKHVLKSWRCHSLPTYGFESLILFCSSQCGSACRPIAPGSTKTSQQAAIPGSGSSKQMVHQSHVIFQQENEDLIEVSNVNGSSGHKRNWSEYWLRHVPRRGWPSTCQIHGCGNPAEVGGHVYIKGLRTQYILPICQGCNKNTEMHYQRGGRTDWANVKSHAALVSCATHGDTRDNNGRL